MPPYVLYFGRYGEEKGIRTLVHVAEKLPEVFFVFAGKGTIENELFEKKNIINIGFQKGRKLIQLIESAQFSVIPSEWCEPFGLSIIESMKVGTPAVIAEEYLN